MNRTIISFAAAAAIFCSQAAGIAPVFADTAVNGTVINDTFDTGDTVASYSLYDSANTAGSITYDAENKRLTASFGSSHGWNDNNGIKTDITKQLEGCAAGDTVKASVLFTSTYWGDEGVAKAKLFLETVNAAGKTQKIIVEGPESVTANDETVTLTGEISDYTYTAGDTVYLCITQPSGMHYYDDISVSVTRSTSPSETAPVQTEPPADGTVVNDTFESGDITGYALYDSANAEGSVSYDAENGRLMASFGDSYGWNESNGIRKDITAVVTSGSKYAVSADVTSTWWSNAPAKLFFEIESGGTVTAVAIDEDVLAVEGEGTVTLAGEVDLAFNEGDKVYLCATQAAGLHYYDSITVTYKGKADAPTETAPVQTEPPADGAVVNDTFETGNTSGYTTYDISNTEAEISADGTLGVNFGSSNWSDKNGVRKDITAAVTSGKKYTASADIYSSWWGGTSAKLFFEVESGGSVTKVAIAEDTYSGEGEGSISLAGEAELWFDEGDKVYICITQAAGYQTYDNVTVIVKGDADERPVETEPPAMETVPPIEDAIFADDFSSTDQADKYSLYDGTNTTVGAGISIDSGELAASMGSEGWNASNGIRRDITEEVKQYISGMTFGVQMKLTAFWGDDNSASATVFFETVSENGSVTVTQIGTMLPEDGSETATMRGTAQLSYNDGDKIYLCVTQLSGSHRYDDAAMWLENTSGEGVIPLTSGTRYTGTYFPASADVIFMHSFSGSAAAEMEQYSPYNEVEWVAAEPRDGGAFFQFPEGGATTRGVVVDITDAIEENIPNGGQVRISCKMLPWWWWGTASVKIRNAGGISDVAIYSAPTGDPGGKWAEIGEIVELSHKPGDKVELIITMDASTATGITIDDVCVELPYGDVTARDIAVADASMLLDINTVSIVYGGRFVTETSVSWGAQETGSNIVYGTTGISGVTARAIITDSAVRVGVSQSDVTTEETAIEYGKAVTAAEGELAFLVDDLDSLNLISAVAGAEPVSGVPETSAKMIARDNGSGVTVEGMAAEAANNDKVILIKAADGSIVDAAYVSIAADGGYAAAIGALPSGSYTAVMTDTGISAAFTYATAAEFEALRNEINSGSATILEDDENRAILGASTYAQLDKLSSSDKSAVYGAFGSQLGSKSRSEAAELFDALVAIKAATSSVSETEWTELLEKSAAALGIADTSVYAQYKAMSSGEKSSVKQKTDALKVSSPESFYEAFAGAVLNTRLVNAGQYSNVQSILKENAELFAATGVDVNSISSSEARYIISNISAGDMTIDAIASLIEEAKNSASSSTTPSGGSGGSGGGGGGGAGGSSGSNTVPGSSIGLNINTQTGQIGSGITSGGNAAADSPLFTDLAGYDWAETAIYSLAGTGVVNGYGDGTFRPGDSVTREAFVKMLTEVFDITTGSASISFDDVPADRWSYGYVCAAAEAGIVTGISETEFAPEAQITRQDAAVMIYRALQYKGIAVESGELTFTDSGDVADYAREAVSALSGSGIINGMGDGRFAPAGTASRAQAAVMLYRVTNTLI